MWTLQKWDGASGNRKRENAESASFKCHHNNNSNNKAWRWSPMHISEKISECFHILTTFTSSYDCNYKHTMLSHCLLLWHYYYIGIKLAVTENFQPNIYSTTPFHTQKHHTHTHIHTSPNTCAAHINSHIHADVNRMIGMCLIRLLKMCLEFAELFHPIIVFHFAKISKHMQSTIVSNLRYSHAENTTEQHQRFLGYRSERKKAKLKLYAWFSILVCPHDVTRGIG